MEIVNKVAQSGLITVDLEEFYTPGERYFFDIKSWLFEELILKEKDFREKIKSHDWTQYRDKFVAISCTADAIIPTWAYMLIATHLAPFAAKVIFGTLDNLEEQLFDDALAKINLENFHDQRLVIKGCSKINVPVSAYVKLTSLLQPVAKSIMYGEACSTVPVYKKR